MKKFNIFTLIVISMVLLTSLADAKSGFGGRSSFGSSRSSFGSSRSSFNSSKPSPPPKTNFNKAAAVGVGAGAVYSSSSNESTNKPTQVTRNNVMSSLSGGKGAKGDAAGVLYKNFQSKQASPILSKSGKINTADIDRVFSPSYRQNRRQEYYGSYAPVQSPQWIQASNHSGGYGIWDLMLFNSMMDNVGDRQMYYHHQNDPSFQSWRTDANKACLAGDKDICEKLADLDKEVAEFKNKGVQVNPNYITPGVDPDIYEANNIDKSSLPSLKICTGAVGSDYSRFTSILEKVTKLKVVSIPSNGSVDNLTKLSSGVCDLAWVQHDLSNTPNLTTVVTTNKPEAAVLLCPKASNVKTIKDLSEKHTVFVGSDQTGSQFTFDKLKDTIPGLNKVKTDTSRGTLLAVGQIKDSTNNCIFGVSSPDYPGFLELDKTDKFQAVEIPPVKGYVTVNIDKSHYQNLTQDQYIKGTGFMWLSKVGGTDSIGIRTNLVTSQSWIEQNKQLSDLLLLERVNLTSSIQ